MTTEPHIRRASAMEALRELLEASEPFLGLSTWPENVAGPWWMSIDRLRQAREKAAAVLEGAR